MLAAVLLVATISSGEPPRKVSCGVLRLLTAGMSTQTLEHHAAAMGLSEETKEKARKCLDRRKKNG